MQDYKRTIYNRDDNYPWERIEKEAERKHMNVSQFILFCVTHYFKDKQRNRFKLNITQVTLGIIIVLQIMIMVILI